MQGIFKSGRVSVGMILYVLVQVQDLIINILMRDWEFVPIISSH